jgi:succinyl-diaminopimelate desuccinylase
MTPAPTSTLSLACELIARNSVTPEDAGCLELIAARLVPLGFALERIDSGTARDGTPHPVLCRAHRCGTSRTAGCMAQPSL